VGDGIAGFSLSLGVISCLSDTAASVRGLQSADSLEIRDRRVRPARFREMRSLEVILYGAAEGRLLCHRTPNESAADQLSNIAEMCSDHRIFAVDWREETLGPSRLA